MSDWKETKEIVHEVCELFQRHDQVDDIQDVSKMTREIENYHNNSIKELKDHIKGIYPYDCCGCISICFCHMFVITAECLLSAINVFHNRNMLFLTHIFYAVLTTTLSNKEAQVSAPSEVRIVKDSHSSSLSLKRSLFLYRRNMQSLFVHTSTKKTNYSWN